MTYTYAVLEVSSKAYQEVRALLEAAGYGHAFHESDQREVIDMHGIALAVSTSEPAPKEPGTTLEASWERFNEEDRESGSPRKDAERRAFYAGAQSFCAVMAGALGDDLTDEESTAQMDAAYSELAKAVEELKL